MTRNRPARRPRPLRPSVRRERNSALILAALMAPLGLSLLAFALYCGFVAGYQGTGNPDVFAMTVALLGAFGFGAGVAIPAILTHYALTLR